MPGQWMIICAQIAVLISALLCYVCAADNKYGTISVVGPAFVNREVTLKATPSYPWGCDVEWKYIIVGNTTFQTMNGTNVKRYSDDTSFLLKWTASIEYNGSNFYAGCSTNETIQTRMTSINMKDIVGHCGALVLLGPIVRGGNVKLGYFPSDSFIQHQTNTTRKWKKYLQDIEIQEGSYEEKIVSDFLYILTIFKFEERNEGTYILNCYSSYNTDSVQLHIPEIPVYPVLGPKSPDFNTTECIYVYAGSDFYCKTEFGTEPVEVVLLLGNDSFVLSESDGNKGFYRYQNVCQQIAGMSRRNVICQVSYKAHDTPDVAHGSLCSVETGSLPVLTVPELLHGENSTLICEVRNAIPAPIIEIHVGNVLHGDVQQTDTFNESSHTFTSSAKVTKANTLWNGKEMCCTRNNRYDFGQKQVSVCKNISMKYPPSDLSMSVNKNIENNKKKSGCYLNMSCQTSKSNPPCAIEWSSDNDYLRYVHSSNWANADNIPLCLFMETSIVKESNPEILNLTCNTGPTCMPCAISWTTNFVFLHPISLSQWTKNSGLGIISVSNALFLQTKDVDGKRIQCSAKCGNDSSDIIHETYTIVFEAFQEAATNPASVVALQFHVSVLYALSGTILLLFITKLALLLFRRCKSQAYEMFLRRRKTAYSDPSSHVYDAVQSTAEATMLHDIRRISASASENISPLSATEEHQAPSNRNVCHYDYVDIPSDQQTHETITQAESYIHAI